MTDRIRKVVMGLGNILSRDEGLGVHAVHMLREQTQFSAELEFLDGGVMGLDLLAVVEECSHLLVLDAVDAGLPGGTIIEMTKDEIPLYKGVELSEHQVSFQEVLGLALFRDRLPEFLHLVGAQPADLAPGLEVSQAVRDAMPEMMVRSLRVLRAWNLK